LRQRVSLFRQVCSAVQYAHAHLVVHADIKPNNIVVTSEGVAKLLDFGVARVLEDVADPGAPPIVAPLGVTHFYASPERRRGAAASTVDDVYSLGVLLNDLIGPPDADERAPSRGPEPTPADLRSISAKATAERPEARYASVDALDADIERWMNGFPVGAHGSAWTYIAGKFLARNRLATLSALAGLILLASASIALGVLYVKAEKAKSQAERRFNDLRDLSRYVLFDVYDRLESVPRSLTLRRDLAAKGQQYLNELAQDVQAPLAVRLDVVEGFRRLARLQGDPGNPSLAQVPVAAANLDRAEAIARALPEDSTHGRDRALALVRIGIARARMSIGMNLDLAAGRRALESAEIQLRPLLRSSLADADARALQLDLAAEKAALLQWDGQYAESIEVARVALPLSGGAISPSGRLQVEAAHRHSRLLDIFAESTYYAGDIAGSVAPYREYHELMKRLAAEYPHDLKVARLFMRARWALGTTLLELEPSHLPEAHDVLSSGLALVRELRVLEPEDRDLIRNEGVMLSAEAQALSAMGREQDAEPMLEKSVELRGMLWSEAPTNWAVARDYAIATWTLANVRVKLKKIPEACDAYRITLEMLERMRAAGRLAKLDEERTLREVSEESGRVCGKSLSSD
jgi:serine/threonine protein kinase